MNTAAKWIDVMTTLALSALALVVASGLIANSAHAQTSVGQYSVKEYAPRAGTSILRDAVRSPNIPVNVRFEELTGAQKKALVAYYPKFEAGNEPPFPMEGLRPVLELALKAQNKFVEKGRMFLWVVVDEKGIVNEVKVVESPSAEMSKSIAGVMMYAKFKPARCNGAPCAMDFPLELEFPDNTP